MKGDNIMKNKILAFLALLICFCTVAAACGGGGEGLSESGSGTEQSGEASGNADYSVTVTDYLGKPCTSGIVVLFMQDGAQAAMQVVNAEGVAVKNLKKGNYTVELKFTDSKAAYYYNKEGLELSAEKTDLKIELLNGTPAEGKELYASGEEHTAYDVKEGGTFLTLKSEVRNYYLFTPTVAGTYEFTTDSINAKIGYYGAPSFVQENSAAEVVDNSFTLSISDSMIGKDNTGTTVIVVGIDAVDIDKCVLKIERIGDPKHSIADEPWTVYKASETPSAFTLESGVSLKNFDLTASTDSYALVYNEEDGSYHLGSKDGKRVYVWLTEEPPYMACFKTVLESVGMNRYFFDDEGNFIKKESYSECLLQYIECADKEKGVYPLTMDLEYIIKQCGEHNGWWKADSHGFIFYNAAEQPMAELNTEIAWLFMCCYAE